MCPHKSKVCFTSYDAHVQYTKGNFHSKNYLIKTKGIKTIKTLLSNGDQAIAYGNVSYMLIKVGGLKALPRGVKTNINHSKTLFNQMQPMFISKVQILGKKIL